MEKMQYGLCCLAHVPVRKTVSDASEMLTELLFGDLVKVVDRYCQWVKVENCLDGYQGWVDSKQLLPLTASEFDDCMADESRFFASGLWNAAERQDDGAVFWLGMGCRLPFFNLEGRTFRMGSQVFQYQGEVMESPVRLETRRDIVVEKALLLLKVPYLWGGKSSFALDCSGMTQLLFRMCGVDLPRDASQQVSAGNDVSLIEEAGKGDLMFFDNADGKIIHVGIYLGDGHIIHSSGCVRIDPVDHQGIFRTESGIYSHHLRLIKRLF